MNNISNDLSRPLVIQFSQKNCLYHISSPSVLRSIQLLQSRSRIDLTWGNASAARESCTINEELTDSFRHYCWRQQCSHVCAHKSLEGDARSLSQKFPLAQMWRRLEVIRSIITAGYHVLFTDLDIAWLQVLPLPFSFSFISLRESCSCGSILWLDDDQHFITL